MTYRCLLLFAMSGCGQGTELAPAVDLPRRHGQGQAALIYRASGGPSARASLASTETPERHAEDFSNAGFEEVPQPTGGAILNLSGKFRHQVVVQLTTARPRVECKRESVPMHAK